MSDDPLDPDYGHITYYAENGTVWESAYSMSLGWDTILRNVRVRRSDILVLLLRGSYHDVYGQHVFDVERGVYCGTL